MTVIMEGEILSILSVVKPRQWLKEKNKLKKKIAVRPIPKPVQSSDPRSEDPAQAPANPFASSV